MIEILKYTQKKEYKSKLDVLIIILLLTSRAFGILLIVPLEILPMVPLVANGIIGNERTLNVSRQPMVPLVPMLPYV